MLEPPFVLIEDAGSARTLRFDAPVEVLTAHTLGDVESVLIRIREAQRAGFHLAGFATYEAGFAFEPRLARLARATPGPLVWFGVFHPPGIHAWDGNNRGDGAIQGLEPAWSYAQYAQRYGRVIDYIRAGDVYQVNLTFPLRGRWTGCPLGLYAKLRGRQPAPFGALVALGDVSVLSFSPEMFFEADPHRVRVRPMKGTAPRGDTAEEDDRLAHRLASNPKDRAENLMIVDLLRNDLSRIAAVGSVRVTDLFTVERYRTVLQMTSGVEAQIRPGVDVPELFGSLFPCGSVTGAPKIRAMEIIGELEDEPRGVYCGSIGHIRPEGSSRFNVAIRTAVLQAGGSFVYNVGSGIVHDSEPRAEYEECLLKARFLEQAIGRSD